MSHLISIDDVLNLHLMAHVKQKIDKALHRVWAKPTTYSKEATSSESNLNQLDYANSTPISLSFSDPIGSTVITCVVTASPIKPIAVLKNHVHGNLVPHNMPLFTYQHYTGRWSLIFSYKNVTQYGNILATTYNGRIGGTTEFLVAVVLPYDVKAMVV